MDPISRSARSAAMEPLEERVLFTLLGQQLFPSDNPWNQAIGNAPVAANSNAIMQSIIGTYGNGKLHPDFGEDDQTSSPLYGIPYTVVHGNSVPKVNVVIDAYADESDIAAAPIPSSGVTLEGDNQNGQVVGQDNRGDSHLILWDEDNNIAYEFDDTSRPSENSDHKWHADSESVWNMNTDNFRTIGFTSADAAGLPILAGLARPDEGLPVSQGGQGVINHALRFTLQNSVILDQFLYPASHVANPGNTNATIQPPMGARFRLKSSVDISGLNPEAKIIATALKNYGMILADNGSNFYISGASYSVDANNHFALTWNDDDIQDTAHGLKSLDFSDFEMVNLTPAVTGLSKTGGAANDQVTITGQNFSGAAGHISVQFGGKPATSVNVMDDSHITATVPSGSGTVDVRVQSGSSDPNDSENINSPLFGYGKSAATSADKFTYGAVTAPSISLGHTITITQGATKPVKFAAVVTGATASKFTWYFGNGVATTIKATKGGATPSFTYSGFAAGEVPVSVTATTVDGKTLRGSVVVKITKVVPVVSVSQSITAAVPYEPIAFTAKWTDPAPSETFTVNWTFTDGNDADSQLVGKARSTTLSRVFAATGIFHATAIVTDKDGGAGRATTTKHLSIAQALVQQNGHLTNLLVGGTAGGDHIEIQRDTAKKTAAGQEAIRVLVNGISEGEFVVNNVIEVFTGPTDHVVVDPNVKLKVEKH